MSWSLCLFVPLGVVGGRGGFVSVVDLAGLLLGGVEGFLVVGMVGGVHVDAGGPGGPIGGGDGRLSEGVGCLLAVEVL